MASQPLSSIRSRLYLYFTKRVLGLHGSLPPGVVREICSYMVGDILLPFYDYKLSTLVLVCPATGERKNKENPCIMGQGYCLMDYRRLFYIENPEEEDENYSKKAAVLRTDTLETEELAEMTALHCFPTVVKLHSHIYIFAGNTKKCESFSVWTREFLRLPVKAPSRFSKSQGCVHLNKIYITPLCERSLLQFDPNEGQFRLMEPSVTPSPTTLMMSMGSEIYQFDSFYVTRWTATDSTCTKLPDFKGNLLHLFTTEVGWEMERNEGKFSISLSCPVKEGNRVYFFSGRNESAVYLTVFDGQARRIEGRTFDS